MKANALILSSLLAVSLAGCSTAPKPQPMPPLPPPRVILNPGLPRPPLPKPPADWRDAARTPGDWSWRREGGRSIAFYGTPRMPTYLFFSLTCEPASRQIEARASLAAGEAPLMTIVTTSQRRALSTSRASGHPVAILRSDDPLLDAMAFSRGRFMVEAPGNVPLYIPSWPEISRVVEDCR